MVEILEGLLILFSYIALAFVIAWGLRTISDLIRYRKAEKMFFNDFKKQLDMGLVNRLENVVRIQQTVSDETMFSPFASENLAPLLRIYLRRITYSKEKNKNKKIRTINSLLNQLTREKPFGILPEKEQEMALRVQESVKEKEKKPKVTLKLLEGLTVSLGEKLENEARINQRNKKLIVIGMVLGALGIVITLTISILR